MNADETKTLIRVHLRSSAAIDCFFTPPRNAPHFLRASATISLTRAIKVGA